MLARRILSPHPPVQYPRLSAIQAVVRAVGGQPSTARQVLNPSDPRNPFVRAAMIAESLLANGHGLRVDALCLPLDLVRNAALLPDVSLDVYREAMEREALLEGQENAAQLYACESAVAFQTWRKRALAEMHETMRAIRIGDALQAAGVLQ